MLSPDSELQVIFLLHFIYYISQIVFNEGIWPFKYMIGQAKEKEIIQYLNDRIS